MGIDKDTYSRTQSDGSYKWKYNVPHLGFKYHGNSIMASVGLVQLKYLDQDNDRRNEICEIYCKFLDNMDGIQTIQNSEYCAKSSKHLFQILVNNNKRDGLISFMYENNIFPGVHYIDNISYPMYNYAEGTCPNSRNYSNQLLSLPLHLGLNKEDIETVVNIIRNYIQK
jgi:dTDP-4-amino-4,6-dideoxygalactose transaminase